MRRIAIREQHPLIPAIDDALAELAQPAQDNHVAHTLVWRAALELLRRATRNHERVASWNAHWSMRRARIGAGD